MSDSDLVLKGAPWKFPSVDIGVGEYFFEKAGELGDTVFQIDALTGTQQTYREVRAKSVRAALHLQKLGIKSEDVVVLFCINNLKNVVPVLASLYLGARVSSLDSTQIFNELVRALQVLEPSLVVAESAFLPMIREILASAGLEPLTIVIDDLDSMDHIEGEEAFRPVKQKASDVPLVFFSSGTTSYPKPINVSNFSILNLSSVILQHNHMKPGMIYQFTSLYWFSAWVITMIVIKTGCSKILAESVSAEDLLRTIEKYRVTTVYIGTFFSHQLTSLEESVIKKYDTTFLYSLQLMGGSMDPQQTLKLRGYFPHSHINLIYASTEGSLVAGYNFAHSPRTEDKISSSGTLFPGVQLKVVDLDSGRLLGPNSPGEIYIKSPLQTSGYYKLSKLDAFDEDGFLKMGDLGYYDEDGYVYVIDRIGEIFKFRSAKICPRRAEEILLRHPAVKEATVFGIPHPVDRNHPAACVSLKGAVSAEELVEYVNEQVEDSYKLRGGVRVMTEIPKTPTGKLSRKRAKEWFMKQEEHHHDEQFDLSPP